MAKDNREKAIEIYNEWQKDRRINQTILAQKHGIAQQTVSRWIRMIETEKNA